MPSLILETVLTGKDLQKRKEQANKWFIDIDRLYSISKDRYIYKEIIFRQCLMHEKFNTPFVYENEVPLTFLKKAEEKVAEFNEAYFKKIKTDENYGTHPLALQKMDRIESAKRAIQKRYADIDKLKDFFTQLQKDGSGISPDDVLAYLDELKIKTNEKIKSNILKSDKHELKKFITITKDGKITVKPKAFDFFRVYSLLMYCLWEPYWVSGLDVGQSKLIALYGIHGYIAKKINFEFGSRLGFKATSKDVADRVRDNEAQIKIYKSKLKALGLV